MRNITEELKRKLQFRTNFIVQFTVPVPSGKLNYVCVERAMIGENGVGRSYIGRAQGFRAAERKDTVTTVFICI
jgi:hypothetical protein